MRPTHWVLPTLALIACGESTSMLGDAGDTGSADARPDAAKGECPAGIAGKYVRDEGIASDPAVVFAEGFEASSVSAVTSRWSSAADGGGLSLVGDVSPGSSGSTSMRMTRGSQGSPDLFKRFANANQIYVRYY